MLGVGSCCTRARRCRELLPVILRISRMEGSCQKGERALSHVGPKHRKTRGMAAMGSRSMVRKGHKTYSEKWCDACNIYPAPQSCFPPHTTPPFTVHSSHPKALSCQPLLPCIPWFLYLSAKFVTQELPWHLQTLVLIRMEESFVDRLFQNLGDRSVIVERSEKLLDSLKLTMLDDLFQYIQEFFQWFSTAWLGLFFIESLVQRLSVGA